MANGLEANWVNICKADFIHAASEHSVHIKTKRTDRTAHYLAPTYCRNRFVAISLMLARILGVARTKIDSISLVVSSGVR